MKKVLLSVLMICLIISAYAGVDFSIDTLEVQFGNTLKMNISSDTGENVIVDGLKIKDFEIMNVNKKDNDVILELLSKQEGNVKIPSFKVDVMDNSGKSKEYFSPTMEIKVNSLLTDTESVSLKTNAPFFDLEGKYNKTFIISFILTLILLVGILIFYLLKRSNKIQIFSKVIEPAHVIAYRDLKELEHKNFIKLSKQKLFCVELSRILKAYLENRYRFQAVEMTTFELENDLRKKRKEVVDSTNIIDLLKKMDLVKFAKYSLDEEVLENGIIFVKDFVNRTKEVKDETSK